MDFSEEELKQIFKIFKDESEEHLGNIDRCLLELEKRPDDASIVAELFREAHSVKGSARMLDITSIQNLAHKMEDLLGLVKEGSIQISSEIIDILCRGVDVIQDNLKRLDYNTLNSPDENSDKLAELIDNLKDELLSGEKKNDEPIKTEEPTVTIKETSETKNPNLSSKETDYSIISHYVNYLDNKFQQNNAIKEILTSLNNLLIKELSNNEREICNLVKQNLEYIAQNQIIPTKEMVQAIDQAINAVFNNIHNEDLSLIIQRQTILKQMMELSKENEKLLSLPDNNAKYQVEQQTQTTKNKTETQTGNYETGIFKTLRVDTQKLDKLENQVEELIVLKIKNKQHLKTLDNIISEIQEIQKKIGKAFVDIKSTDKKFSSTNLIQAEKQSSLKAIQANIDKINEKTQDLYSIIDKFQKNLLNDDTRLNFLADEIENMVKSIRILPLATIFHMFPRMVRDIARTQNKQVDIIITGSETSADKTIIEEIKSPLIHIIRNAIDHGIESPEDRIKIGKNPTGKILLNSFHSGNAITIEITDDGRGLNTESIKKKVLDKNLLSLEELNQLTEMQIMNLIFWPGFTTGDNITEISGRGVGLDVVHTKISQLDGKISIQSQLGVGFKITIKIPITLATLKALLIKVQNQVYAISSTFVKTVLSITDNEIIMKEGKPHIIYNDASVRFIKLSEILNLQGPLCEYGPKHNIVVIQVEETLLAIEVDEFVRTEEILQKKLNPPLTKVRNISGVSSLSSGESCFILNLNDIIKSALSIKEFHKNSTIISLPKKEAKTTTILVTDDSFTTLTLEKNILKSAGYNVLLAHNGQEANRILLYEKVDLLVTDIEMPEMNGIELLRRIRARDNTIPVIVLTSLADYDTRSTCFSLGANDYILKKDFSETLFLNKIKTFLNN